MEKWIYFGIFLDEASKERLKLIFDIPENWKWYGDHVTLCFNDGSELSKVAAEINKGYVGAKRSIKITGIGISENAMALKVQLPAGVVCTNKVAHITIGCKNKPVDSNAIEIWHDIENFTLFGEISIFSNNLKPRNVLVSCSIKMKEYFVDIPDNESQFYAYVNMVINNRGNAHLPPRLDQVPKKIGPVPVTRVTNEVGEHLFQVANLKDYCFVEMVKDQFYLLRSHWNMISTFEEYPNASKY